MKLLSLYAATPNYDLGLSELSKKIYSVFSELGVSVEEIQLKPLNLPYFDNGKTENILNIAQKIRESDGILFLTTTSLFAPNALMQTFLEHLQLEHYRTVLQGKNCFLLTLSPNVGEYDALHYLTKVVFYLGGFDGGRVSMNKDIATAILADQPEKEIFEKQLEDFYRMVGQNRKFFVPNALRSFGCTSLNTDEEKSISSEPTASFSPEEISRKLQLDTFNERQQEDIEQLTHFFAKKFTPKESEHIVETDDFVCIEELNPTEPIAPRETPLKQLTQSMPHHFKGSLPKDEVFTVSLVVNGTETFEGYFRFENNQCNFYDGASENTDIVILSSAEVWRQIIQGKKTVQKSFMTGQLKVRGNFVLLAKFDQLFHPIV